MRLKMTDFMKHINFICTSGVFAKTTNTYKTLPTTSKVIMRNLNLPQKQNKMNACVIIPAHNTQLNKNGFIALFPKI